MKKVEEIKERLSNIGGTPWKSTEYSSDYYKQGYAVKSWNDAPVAECINEEGEMNFIANAPSDIRQLLKIVDRYKSALVCIRDYHAGNDLIHVLVLKELAITVLEEETPQ